MNSSFDFSVPLDLAIEKLLIRNSPKKVIVWLSATAAKGNSFSKDGNKNEEKKLESLVNKLVNNKIYFLGVYFNEKAQNTFEEMEQIYYRPQKGGRYSITDDSLEGNDFNDYLITRANCILCSIFDNESF